MKITLFGSIWPACVKQGRKYDSINEFHCCHTLSVNVIKNSLFFTIPVPIFTGQNQFLLDLSDSPIYFAETVKHLEKWKNVEWNTNTNLFKVLIGYINKYTQKVIKTKIFVLVLTGTADSTFTMPISPVHSPIPKTIPAVSVALCQHTLHWYGCTMLSLCSTHTTKDILIEYEHPR